ncbi:uncharacterized protein LOC123319359 [Coccinella septempunctata]|uniref:uncharacterized protein LOC123319359 n=1 Tax=Coccinella septempunctata TaxID=41139 RepID=UPI001D05CC22|nr:uncharacterized protein LOC123319359 [Coccinella septempunctata]
MEVLRRFVAFFTVICFVRVVHSLKDVVLEIKPRVVHLGAFSTLSCRYDLEDAPLYTVKWYRGHHEFYRYTPKEFPSTKIFPFDDLHVDLQHSNDSQVVLRDVGFNLSGNFSCEVTTDAPSFYTRVVSTDMLVVVLPSNPPTLTTERTFYDSGDVLRANCTSPPSRPASTLTFYLKDVQVCERCVTRKVSTGDLFYSENYLELPLFPSHFQQNRLTLKCVAEIGNLYQQTAELNLYNVNDPIPARVMQSSAVSYNMAILNLAMTLLFLLT